ncbi:penicillin acylase family protein [Roseicella aquatilis]|uniref:penicillin acylase family protein n=1 Tax=Roseicella aquatilis TaxID=2527868 RepID=UPI001F0E514E|nr:penicillin acylase family protein [Roseicella aquatilis]
MDAAPPGGHGRGDDPSPAGPRRGHPPLKPPRRRARHLLRRAGLGLLLLVLLLLGGIAGAVWWTLPARDATLRLPGLSAKVAVTLDEHGIPRIAARTEADAATALGWLHARDRLFQMEMMRRGAAGRLSEIAGPPTLRADRFVRTLGLERRAEADFAGLPDDARALLEAYATGVNAWIAARGRFAAPEFIALGAPEPWRPADSLLWAKVMGLWLSGNWRTELERSRLAGVLPPARLRELFPEDATPGRPDLAGLDPGHLGRLAAALPRFPEPGTLPASASNAWAVAGRRSASGAPLLASDPHLGFGAPILWYLVRIDLEDGRMLAGATSPGVPLLVIGRNAHLAWGFTTTHSDTQDVFVETLAGPEAYETPDGPQPFTVREEVIRVRGAAPVTLRVRETRHGPVISDLDAAPQGDRVLAVAMANLAPGDTAAAGLLALNRAGSLAEARAAAALITSPPQNLMLADRAGRIGMVLTGRSPVRRAGDGTLPAPGWDGSHDWTGWIPFDALPHVEDPASGQVVNANNRPVPPDSPVFLGQDWPDDARFRRIGEMLAAGPRHDAEGFAAMQRDTVSAFARDLLGPDALLRRVPRPEGAAGVAQDLLLAWDGDLAADRPEGLVFNAWIRAVNRLAQARGGVPEGMAPRPEAGFLRLVLAPDGRGAAWCGGDCAALAGLALQEAVAGLAASEGPDPRAWRWGRVHAARFEHPLLRFVPGLAWLTGLSAATGGDEWTVSRGGFRGDGSAPYTHVHGAGLRLVADLADPEATLAVIATGQSGNPASRHWGSLLPLWRGAGLITLRGVPAAVTGRISLEP